MTEEQEKYGQEKVREVQEEQDIYEVSGDKVVIVIEFGGENSSQVNIVANKVTTEQMLLAAKMLDEVAKRSLQSIWNQQEQEVRQRAMQRMAFEKKVKEAMENEGKRKRR